MHMLVQVCSACTTSYTMHTHSVIMETIPKGCMRNLHGSSLKGMHDYIVKDPGKDHWFIELIGMPALKCK